MRRARETAAAGRARIGPVAAVALCVAAGCGAPRIGVAPTDPEYDLRMGLVQEARGKHLDAQEHLKRFLDAHPGHAKADSAQLFLGRAKMGSHLYPEAAVEFQILAQEYPRSTLRDDAAFLECASYFEQVRSPQLDPTLAFKARTCFHEYLVRYPNGTDSVTAVARLAEVADHLAEKDLRLAQMFVRMKRPEAAVVYLEDLLENYPGTRWEADAWLYLGRARELLREVEGAAQAYRKAQAIGPGSDAAGEARERLEELLRHFPVVDDSTGAARSSP
jgi:outer membrane protein assembly factor BamD